MNADYINLIKDIKEKHYLELGIGDGLSFQRVQAKTKTSVDINGRADYNVTTNEFFRLIHPSMMWDIIFIDADHSYRQVSEDYQNSVNHEPEWIIIHDLIPPSKKHTSPRFCGDGYKFLWYLIEQSNKSQMQDHLYPMSENYGMTFIRFPFIPIEKTIPEMGVDTYEEFMSMIQTVKLWNKPGIRMVLEEG